MEALFAQLDAEKQKRRNVNVPLEPIAEEKYNSEPDMFSDTLDFRDTDRLDIAAAQHFVPEELGTLIEGSTKIAKTQEKLKSDPVSKFKQSVRLHIIKYQVHPSYASDMISTIDKLLSVSCLHSSLYVFGYLVYRGMKLDDIYKQYEQAFITLNIEKADVVRYVFAITQAMNTKN
jgi:hypothetical protein